MWAEGSVGPFHITYAFFKYKKHEQKQWQDTEESLRDQRGDSWEPCQSAEEAADDSEILIENTDRRHISNGVIWRLQA